MPGLPPRARGRPGHRLHRRLLSGTTPACAGKTSRRRAGSPRCRDYPRVRGEDGAPPKMLDAHMGLPPRARGRRRGPAPAGPEPGTTPACAGKTPSGISIALVFRDYPRVRGEDPERASHRPDRKGLPPRARGRLFLLSKPDDWHGTTPACAGKTLAWKIKVMDTIIFYDWNVSRAVCSEPNRHRPPTDRGASRASRAPVPRATSNPPKA